MKIWKSRKRTMSLAPFGFCLLGLILHGAAQQFGAGSPQSALVFQPGIMTTLAGTGVSGHTGDGGAASAATVTNGIRGIAVDGSGDVFFIDDTNQTIRVVYEGGTAAASLITAENPTVTSPVAGNIYVVAGGEGSSGTPATKQLATSARIKAGAGLGIDAAGDLYFVDTGTNKVWAIYAGGSSTAGTNLIALEAAVASPTLGDIYPVAGGSSTSGYTGDGKLATNSGVELLGINDIKFDTAGNMYLVDQGNNAIREVSATTGIITTIAGGAGGAGTAGNSGNGGPATAALLNQPYGVAVDAFNNVYISDKSNNLVRVVYEGGSTAAALITLENPTIPPPLAGDIYTVAGGGNTIYPYGVLASSGKLNGTTMITLDPAGNIYLAENGYNLVAEVNVTTGYITVVAGAGAAGTATGTDGDGGAATSGTLNSLRCLTVDAAGRIYITDASDMRIRQVGPQGLIVFPGQAANTTSAPLTILLNNNGNAALNFTGGSPIFGGQNYADFALDGSSALNTCNLTPLQSGASCVLALTYTPLGLGTSSASLSYNTDGALSTQQILLQGASLPSTTTTLQTSAQSVIDGLVVTFSATVTGGASPAGPVSFYNNGSPFLGTATLNGSGVATLPYTSTATGTLSVTATYIGNATNAASNSNTVLVNVTGSSTSTTMENAAPTALNQGQGVTLTATVAGGGVTPTGSVVFNNGGTSLGSGTLDGSGVARLSTTALPVGPNSIQALYLGDVSYAASTSSAATVQVFGIPVVTLTASATVINQGLSETITGTVTGSGVTPTGTLTFYDGATVLGTGTLASGVGTLATRMLPGGANTLTATFSGDGNYVAGAAPAITVTVNVQSVAFVHPGGWLTAADITRIRSAVANQAAPYYAAYLALPATPSTTFVPTGIAAEVTAGTINSSSLTSLQGNEENIWILAVKWVATGTPGYATALCGAIDDYSALLTTMDGNNGSLRAGIYGGKLAEAAEICAYANPAWPNKARAQAMFRQAFAQDIHDFSDSNIPNGNWETSCLHGMISIAIFLDDRDLFNRAVNYYLFGQGNGRVSNYVINAAGQVQESGRDQGHTMDGINHLAETAEDAWHQGIDLYGAYNNRLLAGFEYTGEYTSGAGTPVFVANRDAWNDPLNSYATISATASPLSQPNWEMVNNHYVSRQGLGAPYTSGVVTASGYRPEPASQDFAGMGTLEFTRSPGQADPVTSIPVPPIILSSYGTPSGISINWVGSVGATSYNVKRATTSGGPYATIASVTGESTYTYLDATASTTGIPYFYLVTAVNSFGESAAGAEARASFGLPSPWANADIGTLGRGRAGGTDYLGASTFSLRASGAVIGNSANSLQYNLTPANYSVGSVSVTSVSDSFQFAYVPTTGDGQIVARVTAPLSPVASSAGLMMRDSLNSNAAMVANMAQYTGLALVTSRATDGATAVAMGPVQISTAAAAPSDESSLFVGPYWVKLTRLGNTFTSSVSPDNVTWTQINQQTITMPSSIYAGLTLASGNSTLSANATFDEVNLPGWTPTSTAPTAPANLTAIVGKGVQLTWSTAIGATSYTLTRSAGSGGTTTLATIPAPASGLYAALPGTIYYVDYTGTPENTYSYSVSATGAGGTGPGSASTSAVAPPLSAPFIVDSLNVPYATGTVGLPLTYPVQVSGVATFSASGLPSGLTINPSSGVISGTPTQSGVYQPIVTASNSAGIDSWIYTFTIVGNPLPAGMQQSDIGFLEAPGITGTSGTTITNTGAGVGVGAVCDDFHFAYYQLTGDGSIVVNLNSVTTISPTTTLSQTGIMMRNTLTCDSLMFGGNAGIGGATSVTSLYRTATNAGGTDYIDASSTSGANVTLPMYLQVTRSGNNFSAYSSPDGVTWALITTKTIAMNNTIYVGLDVTPQDDSPTNASTGTYSNIAITSAASSLINSPSSAIGTVGVPFSFTITSTIFPAAYSATSASGLPPGLTLDPNSGIISGTPKVAGLYSLTAGMSNGAANGTAPLTITIQPASQTITFTAPPAPVIYGVAPIMLSATGGASGNAVTFSMVSGPGAVSGNTLTVTGAGAIVIAANQAGNANFNAAPAVQQAITVSQASSTLNGPALSAQAVQVVYSATGSIQVTLTGQYSGAGITTPSGSISYTIGTGTAQTAAIASGSATVTVPNTQLPGTYTVTVTYAGDANYNAASILTFQVQVEQIQPTMTWTQPAALVYGATLSSVLNASAAYNSSTVAGTYAYTATSTSGSATAVTITTILPAGSYTLNVSFTPSNATTDKSATGSVTLVVNKAVPAIGLVASVNPVLAQNAITLTATATGVSTPTSAFSFFDGTTLLGNGTLSGGVAIFTTSSLVVGSHSITALYSGDANFVGVTSSKLTEVVDDFSFNISIPPETAPPGGTAVFTFTLTPVNSAAFPATITLTASGLPSGATYIFSPATLIAGSGAATVTLTMQIPPVTASAQPPHGIDGGRSRRLVPFALALLLLPFAGRMRRTRNRLGRMIIVLLLMGAGIAATMSLSGCAATGNSYFGQPQQNYTVTVTGTAGTLSHSTTVTLTVE